MLLWAGLAFLALGLACFAIDRRAVHFFHDRINRTWFRRIRLTTDYAKGAYWLSLAIAVLVVTWLARMLVSDTALLREIFRGALAFLVCLAIASVILHSIKLVFGRRRPRDELEHELYGFRLFHYDWQHDSFPSGHAMTIFCAGVILSGTIPALALLWFAIAVYLSFTRALINSHFLSDVFIGAAIGMLAARETVLFLFHDLSQPWF
jgi:membrane-associated phospholipid phosphatase